MVRVRSYGLLGRNRLDQHETAPISVGSVQAGASAIYDCLETWPTRRYALRAPFSFWREKMSECVATIASVYLHWSVRRCVPWSPSR